MTDYNAQMESRLTRMDALFQRADAFMEQLNQLRMAYGLTQNEEFHQLPTEEQQEAVETIRETYDAVEPTMNETQDAYNDIDIDSIIASMDLGIQMQGVDIMWQTVEHLLNHAQAVERVKERLDEYPLLLDYADEVCEQSDKDVIAEGIMNQMYGVLGQFKFVTAEALDSLPHQVYQDMMTSEFTDDLSVQDSVANAFTAIDPANGDVLTFNETLQILPYLGLEKPAPILDNYDIDMPTIITNHEGVMNPTQESYNKLSDEQRQFLAAASEGVGRSLIVDSQQEFAKPSEQFRSDNEFMKLPYDLEENARLIRELFNMDSQTESLQL